MTAGVDVEGGQGGETVEAEKGSKGQAAQNAHAVPYFQLYSEAQPQDLVIMAVGIAAPAVNGASWPCFAIVFGTFANVFGQEAGTPGFMDKVSTLALYFLYIALASGAAAYLQSSLTILVGSRLADRMRTRYLASVLRQDIAFFDTQATTGELLKGLNEDGVAVQAAISEKVAQFCQNVATFVAGWIVAFVYGWDMALLMLGCLPFLVMVGATMSKITVKMTENAEVSYRQASSMAQQALSQIRTVVSYGGEEKAITDYAAKLEDPVRVGWRQSVVTGISLGSVNAVMYYTFAIAFFYGAWRVSVGAYTGGKVLQVLVAALLGGFSLGQAAPTIQTLNQGRSAGANMFKVIDRRPAIDLEAPGEEPAAVVGEIELRNVRFAYPARPDVWVFKDFSLTIPAGKTVALVGSSGSGKSTVVGLIERFYDPASGCVLLDGRDLRSLQLKWLRIQVGLVSQEPTLFATTIFENIAMGRPGAGAEEVEAAARAANAHGFISLLPEGYNTQCGERGLQLSGGQKQRIAIARAILKNPRVLCLDEATSALDTQSERVVQEALDRMVVGRTTVVVAHRLSTIQHADCIAVVHEGQVVEQGTHEELTANPVGVYTALVRLQMQHEEEQEHVEGELDAEGEGEEGEGENGGEEGSSSGESGEMQQLPEAQALRPSGPNSGDVSRQSAGPASGAAHVALEVHSGACAADREGISGQLPRGSRGHSQQLQKRSSPHQHPHQQQAEHKDPDSGLHRRSRAKDPGGALPDPQQQQHGEAGAGAGAKPGTPPAVKVPMRRLLSYNKPEWPYGVVGVAASAAAGVVRPAFAFVMSSIITVFYGSNVKSEAGFWSLMFFTIGTGHMIVCAVQQYCFGCMGQELARRVRLMLLRAMLYQEIGWFDLDANASGVLTSRLASDATFVRGAVGDTIGLVLQDIMCLAAGYLIAFAYMWRMALVITGALPFMLAGAVIYYRTISGFESGTSTLYASANQAVSDAFSSIRVVQAYNLQDQVTSIYAAKLGSTAGAISRRCHVTGASSAYSQFATFAAYSLLIWFGGYEVHYGRAGWEGEGSPLPCGTGAAIEAWPL